MTTTIDQPAGDLLLGARAIAAFINQLFDGEPFTEKTSGSGAHTRNFRTRSMVRRSSPAKRRSGSTSTRHRRRRR